MHAFFVFDILFSLSCCAAVIVYIYTWWRNTLYIYSRIKYFVLLKRQQQSLSMILQRQHRNSGTGRFSNVLLNFHKSVKLEMDSFFEFCDGLQQEKRKIIVGIYIYIYRKSQMILKCRLAVCLMYIRRRKLCCVYLYSRWLSERSTQQQLRHKKRKRVCIPPPCLKRNIYRSLYKVASPAVFSQLWTLSIHFVWQQISGSVCALIFPFSLCVCDW